MTVFPPSWLPLKQLRMKQILLVNDIAGYGKVGMAAMLPVLSYMGIPAFCLPTALVSNTLNYTISVIIQINL